MKKHLLIVSALLCSFLYSQSQYTLEQVDFTSPGFPAYNTYMMDINNRGYSCGYFTTSGGQNIGFVITRKGVRLLVNQALTGSTDNRVVSINDNNVALVSTDIGGVTTLYKMYVADEEMTGFVQVNGLGQNPVTALKINNLNDISGWYQGVNSRWLFVLHDSIVPAAQPVWQATRYHPAAYYNTWGSGVNNNNQIGGFYLDAPNFYPFLCDVSANTYQILTAPSKTKVWDMNNNNVMVGEYQQGNGFYMAFIGTISGNTLNVTSLANIFHNNTIQSVANGISDNGMVVGNFLDPNTSTWKGFIYRPGQDKYKYDGWNFVKHSWNFINSSDTLPGNTTCHWNKDFFDQYVNYNLFDNYLYNGDPLNDSIIIKKYNKPTINNYLHPDWKSFAIEADNNYTPNGSLTDKLIYKYFKKYALYDKYVKFIKKSNSNGKFTGDCFGFTTLSMMYFADDNSIHQKFNVPQFINLSTVNNMDSVCKRAITRGQLQQFDKVLRAKYKGLSMFPWFGLYRTKTYMSDPLQYVDYRVIGITLVDGNDTGGHAIFPYEIRTPKKLPYLDPVTTTLEADTVMVYDPNYPMDSTQYLLVGSDWVYNEIDFFSPAYNVIWTNFELPTYTELKNTTFAALKAKRSFDTLFDFCFSPNTDYIINKSGQVCSQINNVYSNGIPSLIAEKGTGPKAFRPLFFTADTADLYNIQLRNYNDNNMSITKTVDDITMGISREAMLSEKDNFTIKRKQITYGNPDNINKNITCHFVQTHDGASQSVNIVANQIAITPNDSLITKTPYDYAYQIIHPGGNNVTYNLDIYALYNDSVKHFVTNTLPLNTNTSHLIDPYYNGPNGLQTVIYVDNGLNGNNDDTLFVPEIALGSGNNIKNVDYIKTFPNPIQNILNVQINHSENTVFNIIIADLGGRIVARKTINQDTDLSSTTINMENFTTGNYFIIVFDKNNNPIYVDKLLKK